MKRALWVVLNRLTFRRLEALDQMRRDELESRATAAATRANNRRTYWAFRESGLDLPNINATLFDGKGYKP